MDIGKLLLETVIDTAKMLPFLFVAYLVIEIIEHKKSHTIEKWLARGGRFGYVPGALLGIVPQCGFSAMAANFYASHVITPGTLIAVFVATSDEAIPVMLAHPTSWPALGLLLLIKLVWGMAAGLLVDVVATRVLPKALLGGYANGEDVDCHQHKEEDGILLATAKHTANIISVVFVFTFVFGLLVAWLGEGRIVAMLGSLGPLQPVVAGLFGLIPNCASSVLLTELYVGGSIRFSSMLAGLCCNAGVGLLVLFRTNRNPRQNLLVLALLIAAGLLPGLVLYLIGF